MKAGRHFETPSLTVSIALTALVLAIIWAIRGDIQPLG